MLITLKYYKCNFFNNAFTWSKIIYFSIVKLLDIIF